MKDGLINTLIAGTVVTASVATFAAVSPMLQEWQDFTDYTPPNRFYISWFDYMDEYGNPSAIQYTYDSSGHVRMKNTVTANPTVQKDFPYRAVFVGGKGKSSGPASDQYHDAQVIMVYSKQPSIDLFSFTYNETKSGYGYIRAQLARPPLAGSFGDEIAVVQATLTGMPAGTVSYSVRGLPQLSGSFDFDFWYECCEGNLEIKGLRGITDCPYAYIRTCLNENGSGGGSTGGTSSGSGGSSSGDSSSSGGGSYSSVNPKPYDPYDPWESSNPGPWENSGSWDWQSQEPNTSGWDISRPPYNGGEEGNTGEKGDTWELPEWKPIQPPFTDKDAAIPPLPINPEYREPAFPDVDIREGYPDPDLPSGEWPPPMPPPTQSSLKKGGAERATAFDRLCPL